MSAARAERFADRWFMSSSCANSTPPLLPVAPLLPPRLICCAVTFKDSNTPCWDAISDSRSCYAYHTNPITL